VDPIRRDIAAGRASIGTWLMNPGAGPAEAFAKLGFGWIIVDLQHGHNTFESAASVIPALELGGASALVRVGWNDPAQIMRALDLGAIGVIVPCVSSADEAAAAARAAHYPPLGHRSLGPIRSSYGGTIGLGKTEPLCIVMVESVAGLDALDAITAVDGIDAILLGPGDLALDMGLLPTAEPQADVVDAARRIAEACLRTGKISAAASFSHAASLAFLGVGIEMLAVGTDAQFLEAGARLVLGRISELDSQGATRLKRGAP